MPLCSQGHDCGSTQPPLPSDTVPFGHMQPETQAVETWRIKREIKFAVSLQLKQRKCCDLNSHSSNCSNIYSRYQLIITICKLNMLGNTQTFGGNNFYTKSLPHWGSDNSHSPGLMCCSFDHTRFLLQPDREQSSWRRPWVEHRLRKESSKMTLLSLKLMFLCNIELLNAILQTEHCKP